MAVREAIAGVQRDSALRAQLLQAIGWLGPVFWLAIWLAARVLRDRGHLGEAGYGWLVRLGVPLAILLALVAASLFRRIAEAMVGAISASGAQPAGPAFSLEEAMIARGEYRQARATLEARLGPGGRDDAAVHLRLADLCLRHLADPDAAERALLAARRAAGAEEPVAIGNGLIDLYRARDDRGRLMVELARFASRWGTTPAGRAAREELRQLKADSQ